VDFGGLVRAFRTRALYTQEELAALTGLSVRHLREIESGRAGTPRGSTVRMLAGTLALSPPDRETFELAARGGPRTATRQPDPLPPAQLPPDVTAFVGREGPIAELDTLARPMAGPSDTVLVLAITGTAGVGKTALAVHWAHRVRTAFPGGQLYVNLRGYDPDRPVSAADALAALLSGLGVAGEYVPAGEEERAARFRTEVADRRILILLDNASSVDQVRPLLPGTPSGLVLVTSRDSLSGLVARDGAHRVPLEVLPAPDAGRLLRRLIGARVDADPCAAAVLADRCARLPLALRIAAELAAARPSVALGELAGELEDQQTRLELLDAGGDPWSDVAAVLSWSMRHLPPDVVRLFSLLSLHPGTDFDSYAAAALAEVSRAAAARGLRLLARAHLIHPTGPDRYGMHDLLRAYATSLARAEHSTELRRSVQDRLFGYYLGTAAGAMNRLHPADAYYQPVIAAVTTPQPVLDDAVTAREWLDSERHTLIAVAAHTATHAWPAHAIRLSAVLFRYLIGGHHTDALAVHEHAVHAARHAGDLTGQAQALTHLGATQLRFGRNELAARHLRQALAVFQRAGDLTGQARALTNLGDVDQRLGDYPSATRRHERALVRYRDAGDRSGEAHTLTKLGIIQERLGRYREAVDHHEQALALFRLSGDDPGEAAALSNLGDAEGKLGRYGPATEHLERALTLYRQTGNPDGRAWALDNLGALYARRGQPGRAAEYRRQSLSIHRETGERYGEVCALNGLGESADRTGCIADAVRYHLAAHTVAAAIGDRHQLARAHAGLGHARHALGEAGRARYHFEQAWILYRRLGTPEAERIRDHLDTGRPGDGLLRLP
jgi:tetratricopeptide (TPR) repeat protein/transcriptional regulator with XRE-family HTH domain